MKLEYDRRLSTIANEVNKIQQAPELFNTLMQDFKTIKHPKIKVISQIVSQSYDAQPAMFHSSLDSLVDVLAQDVDESVKRVILRIFQTKNVSDTKKGQLIDLCIDFMRTLETSIAVKAFSITVARRICEDYPELSGEIIPLVELLYQQSESAGVRNRAGKELKKLQKLNRHF